MTTNVFVTGLLLGFGIGMQLANLCFWLLFRRLRRRMRTELDKVIAEHARIEKALLTARHEAMGGQGLPPELRQ
jgi:hypothetical protein